MHPLLNRRSYLGAYLAVWLPLACLLIFLIKVSGGIGTLETTILLLPMAILYAAACLSTWYTCRATPLRSAGMTRLFVTHIFASFLLSFVWVQIGRLYARALSTSPSLAGLGDRYDAHAAILVISGVLLYLVNVGFFYVLIATRGFARRRSACPGNQHPGARRGIEGSEGPGESAFLV